MCKSIQHGIRYQNILFIQYRKNVIKRRIKINTHVLISHKKYLLNWVILSHTRQQAQNTFSRVYMFMKALWLLFCVRVVSLLWRILPAILPHLCYAHHMSFVCWLLLFARSIMFVDRRLFMSFSMCIILLAYVVGPWKSERRYQYAANFHRNL